MACEQGRECVIELRKESEGGLRRACGVVELWQELGREYSSIEEVRSLQVRC